MPNYKVVDADKLDADLGSVADAIRKKGGTEDELAFPAGFKSAVEGIKGSLPDGETESFGMVYTYTPVQKPTGKALYNGVLLPEIPADVLAENPYCWIRKNASSGNYDLCFAPQPWYHNSGMCFPDISTVTSYRYTVPIETSEAATEWAYANSGTYSYYTTDSSRTVMWANHDILNGSATATEIYLAASEPVPEMETVYELSTALAEREVAYGMTAERLNALAVEAQRLKNTEELQTPAQILGAMQNSIARMFSATASGFAVKMPEGLAESSWNTATMRYSGQAIGILPTVYQGAASVVLALDRVLFAGSAVGEVTEE